MTSHSPAQLTTTTSNQPLSDLGRLAFLTAEALEAVVDAALDGDRTTARRVLRRSSARKTARIEAETSVRRVIEQLPPRTGSLRRTACALQLISELGRIATLVDAFARYIADSDLPESVREVVGPDLVTIGRAGAERLRRLAVGLPSPEMDAQYIRCGCELRGALDRLACGQRDGVLELIPRRMSAVSAGAALAEAILVASRHASRAA